MSEWGTRRDAIAAVFRATVAEIPADDNGVTHGFQPVDKLRDSQYPHVWIGSYVENITELTWKQQETTVSVVVLYADHATQEAMSQTADALRDAINADSTTGYVVGRELGEVPGKDLKVLRFEIEDKEIT